LPFSVCHPLLFGLSSPAFLFVIPEGDLLLAFAVAVASEIGPGFSPDIKGTK
jgi:hypothetical protein